MVFSSATQPDFDAIQKVDWKPTEIMPEYTKLFRALRRTRVKWRLEQTILLEQIACEMAELTSVCVIVNLRKHARKLLEQLKELCNEEELFFITTDLCMAHRRIVVKEITRRLKEGMPCRVVATQCIEAGVDLDFDVMYRALAPLDSIIQAAGRCKQKSLLVFAVAPCVGARIEIFPHETSQLMYERRPSCRG